MVFVIYDILGVYLVSLMVSNVYGSIIMELMDVIIVLFVLVVLSFIVNIVDDIIFDFVVMDVVVGVSYSWDFGDDMIGDGEMISYIYMEDGMYEVMLIVINECGSEIVIIMVMVIIILMEMLFWMIGLQFVFNLILNWLYLMVQLWLEMGELCYCLINIFGQ